MAKKKKLKAKVKALKAQLKKAERKSFKKNADSGAQ